MNIDKTYISVAVVVIIALLKLFKVPVIEEQLTPLVTSLITSIFGIIALYDTKKIRGLTALGAKK